MARIRIEIDLDDELVPAVMARFGVETESEAVDAALRYVTGQPMTQAEATAMRGAHAVGDVPPDVPPPRG